MTPSDMRVAAEPSTLQMAISFAPLRFASCIPAIVSAVSPDCVTPMTSVRSSMIGSR